MTQVTIEINDPRRPIAGRDRRIDSQPNEELRVVALRISLGVVLLALSSSGVAAVLLGDDQEALNLDLQSRFRLAKLVDAGGSDGALAEKVAAYIERPDFAAELPLDMRGTNFQKRVWQELMKTRPGETVTYSDMAARIGAPRAVRSVARACAANNIAALIPCHRVVRMDGSLSGYAWGIQRKQALLCLESQLFRDQAIV